MDVLPKSATRTRIKALVALSMAFAAGCVDIIGYISFGQVFTAHMTGTTVHLGEQLVHANWWKALEMAAMLISFVGGSVAER